MQFSPKMARQFAGLTQMEMAERLGVSRDTYRRIEAHPETATISQGKMIAAVTGVSFDTIFFGGNSTKSRVSTKKRPRPEGRGRRGTISFSSGNAWPTRR